MTKNLLEEILIAPSTVILENRFDQPAENHAGCGGQCIGPGGCQGLSAENE